MQIPFNSPSDIEELLVKLIKKSCEDVDCVIDAATVPTRDLKDFDSLSILEVLTELEEESGLHFEDDIFFVDLKAKTYRSVQEVSITIWNELQKGGNSHG